jgi:hypothetical protein
VPQQSRARFPNGMYAASTRDGAETQGLSQKTEIFRPRDKADRRGAGR